MREEILNKLNEMKEVLSNDITSIEKIDEELEKISKDETTIKLEISELETKLSDDSNYPVFTYMRNQARIADYEEKIAGLKQEQLENNANIANSNVRINYLDGEIEACNELLSEDQRSIEELGRQLRSLGETPDPELEKNITDEITYHRNNITYLMNELNALEEEKSSLINSLNSYNAKSTTLEEDIDKYDKLLSDIKTQEEIESKDLVDHAKKDQDLAKLEQLRSEIEVLNNRREYLSYDFDGELDKVITDLNGGASFEDMALRLSELKSKVPDVYINKNSESRLTEINNLKSSLSSEKAALELKLSDEVNYTPSVFEVEVMHDEISSLENSVSKQDANIMAEESVIGRQERTKQSINFDIMSCEDRISSLEKKNEQLRLRNVLLSGQMTEEEFKTITKQMKDNNKEIANIRAKIERSQKAIVEIDLLISSHKKLIKDLETIRNKDIKELEAKKESLNDRKTINKAAYQEDKNKLELISNQIKALEDEEKIIKYDFKSNLDEAIEQLKNNENKIESSKPEDISAEDMLKKMHDPNGLYSDGQFEDMITNNSSEEETHEEEKDDEEISGLPIAVGPVVTHGDSEEKTEDEIDEDKPVIITGFKKLKDKLIAKLKDTAFIKKATALLLAAATALTLGYGIGKLKNKDIPETPQYEITETVTDVPNDDITENEIVDEVIESVQKKSNYEMALEVIRGEWGNNPERKERLLAAGYDYYAIQSIVDDLMKDYNKNDNNENTFVEEEQEEIKEETNDEQKDENNDQIIIPSFTPTDPEIDEDKYVETNQVVINPGDTFVTSSGYVVDNSNGANDNLIPDNANKDYSDGGISVETNKDGSLTATVPGGYNGSYDSENDVFVDPAKQEDYYKILEEMGIYAPKEEESKSYGK